MAKPSVEQIKDESNYLQGSLADDLANPEVTHFEESGKQLLKFHGIYQQDDRDSRKERKKQKLEPLYFFMVRSKLPGGKMTPEQYLTQDRLCEDYANGTLRLTTRQAIQFHGIFKGDLKKHMQGLNEALVSTLAACGDVSRNVMASPAPIKNNAIFDEIQQLADNLSDHLCPQTPAYHEIWLNGQKAATEYQDDVVEPIYGKHYLPRKFKIAVAHPQDNSVDILCNDLGYLAVLENDQIVGYDVFVGGGQGMTHGMEKTYPRLATPLCFVKPDETLDIATAVVKVQRDFGNREDRKVARMKYTIDRMGQQEFANKVAEYLGRPLTPYTGSEVTKSETHLGWHEQGDGKWYRGISILTGRIKDEGDFKLRTALRTIVEKFQLETRITGHQNLLLCHVDEKDKNQIDQLLKDHGVQEGLDQPPIYHQAMACPATPTCGLALSDSERVFGDFLADLYKEMDSLGLGDEELACRMTGCPNGCARPYNCDIGLVGRQPGKYVVFLGGNVLGDELSFLFRDRVPMEDIIPLLRGPFKMFKEQRQPNEGFGPFCQRVGKEKLDAYLETMAS